MLAVDRLGFDRAPMKAARQVATCLPGRLFNIASLSTTFTVMTEERTKYRTHSISTTLLVSWLTHMRQAVDCWMASYASAILDDTMLLQQK